MEPLRRRLRRMEIVKAEEGMAVNLSSASGRTKRSWWVLSMRRNSVSVNVDLLEIVAVIPLLDCSVDVLMRKKLQD